LGIIRIKKSTPNIAVKNVSTSKWGVVGLRGLTFKLQPKVTSSKSDRPPAIKRPESILVSVSV
jgi:hypothetical protein